MGADLSSLLLFVHAILGCDSTSQPFGVGKGKALKKVKQKPSFAKIAETLTLSGLSHQEIVNLAEEALVEIYNDADCRGRMTQQSEISTLLREGCQKFKTHCHQLRLQPSSTAYVCITKSKNGREILIWTLRNMVGN